MKAKVFPYKTDFLTFFCLPQKNDYNISSLQKLKEGS